MTSAIQIMTDEEIRGCRLAADDEAGFGALATEKGRLPLQAMSIEAEIAGLVSHVTLRQTFKNTFAEAIEATYVFPLPDRAGVTGFRMEVNGRIIDGEIKERGQARREYTEAIKTGHRAAITEEERAGVFTMRVGNLMPGEVATVRLTLTGPLSYDDGEATFRFPLVVAPRYIPGQPLEGEDVGDGVAHDTTAVPDASRITPPVLLPGFPNPVELELKVQIDPTDMPISDLKSSLFAIEEQAGAGSKMRRLAIKPGERLNRDFILRFKVGDAKVRTSLVLNPDAKDASEGTFLLTFVPPPSLAQGEKPRDVVFVLDRSGSMGGWKMVAARRAVGRMIDTLRAQDNFTVYAFDDTIETPEAFKGTRLVAATDRNRFRGIEFLAKLEARGGTEMAQPLDQAAAVLSGGYQERDRILVLVTDGQVGNEDQILRQLGKKVKNTRIFTLGVDRAVNEAFLKRLAAIGGGLSELVESEDRLDDVMDKIHRRIGTPLLTELAVVPSGLEIAGDSIVPRRAPDLFSGAPLFITGRYRGAAKGSVTVTGHDGVGRAWSEQITGAVTSNSAISTIWARGQVRELEDAFVLQKGDPSALEKQIVETSLRFKVLCRFTAYLAVDKSEKVNPGGELHKVMQPVEAPEGWAMFSTQALGNAAMPLPGGGRAMFHAAAASMPRMRAGMPAPAPAMMPIETTRGVGPAQDFEQAEAFSGAGDAGDLLEAPVGAASMPMPMSMPVPPSVRRPTPLKAGAGSGVMRLAKAILGGLGKSEDAGEEERTKKKAEPGIDLDPYRKRAKAMIERLELESGDQSATHEGRVAALGILAAHLKTLVEDLESVGASRDVVEPLQILLRELRDRVLGPTVGETEAIALVARAETVLRAFMEGTEVDAEPDAEAGASSRGDFWKKV